MSPSTPSHDLKSKKDKLDAEFNEQSTATSSTVEVETEKKRDTGTDEEVAVAESVPQDSGDYPSGLKLTFIVVALVLSVFLFSLDQVSLIITGLQFSRGHVLMLTLNPDHRCNRHSKDY